MCVCVCVCMFVCVCIYIYIYVYIGLVDKVLVREYGFNPQSSHTKYLKILLHATLLYTQHYKVRVKGKVEQSSERNCVFLYTSV